MTDSWHSYSKIYAIGHRATHDLFNETVTIEEKVDGSQFSFGRFGDEIRVRSKGRVFNVHAPDSMFRAACETVLRLAPDLLDGVTYRGEVLQKPKHNVLAYERVPTGNIIVFDIGVGNNDYMGYEAKAAECERIGLECVPLLFEGVIEGQHQLDELKGRISVLGGQPIEGYVVKNYDRFNRDGKTLMGKWVSERFKEIHRRDYKAGDAVKSNVHAQLAKKYTTEARWDKAVQRLAEVDRLKGEPADIGPLIKAVQSDILDECKEEIMEDLFKEYWKTLSRNVVRGLPEWYKAKLEASVFSDEVE